MTKRVKSLSELFSFTNRASLFVLIISAGPRVVSFPSLEPEPNHTLLIMPKQYQTRFSTVEWVNIETRTKIRLKSIELTFRAELTLWVIHNNICTVLGTKKLMS
jgi:hypothetical protein